MSEFLLINPRAKKRRKGRMPAGLRRYWAAKRAARGSKKVRRRRARRRNPVVHRRRHVVPYAGKIRRRRARARHRSKRRYVAMATHHRRRRRNPRMLGSLNGTIRSTVVPAGVGALGGLVLDVVYGKVSPMLPTTLQTGMPAFAAKAAAAVGLGMLAGRFVGRDRAKTATIGAVTVLFYGALKTYLMANVPSLGLSGFQDFVTYNGQPNSMGAYMGPRPAGVSTGMGAYMGPRPPAPHARLQGLGTLSPAPFVSGAMPAGSGLNGWGYDDSGSMNGM